MNHDETRDRWVQDNNRAILHQVVGHVRDHLTECHPGEDVDCAGVLAALEDSSRWEVLTLLNTALCRLAQLPDSPDVAALEMLLDVPAMSTPDDAP